MFRCGSCNTLTKPREKATRLVTATRPRVYYNERGVKVGEGFETVREINLCPSCVAYYNANGKVNGKVMEHED